MQKLVIGLLLLLLFSCNKDSSPSQLTQPNAEVKPSIPIKPEEPKESEDPIFEAKYKVLRKEFLKEKLLCEESTKDFCFSEDSLKFQYFALETLIRVFKLKNKEEILEQFEQFIDVENRTLYPKEK